MGMRFVAFLTASNGSTPDIHVQLDELGGQSGESINVAFSVSELKDDRLSLDVAEGLERVR